MAEQKMDWYGPDTATFGDRLAAARDAASMTQAQLARRLGIKPSTLVNWEDDLSEPRANRLSMLAGLLNVSIIWLLTGEGDGVDAPDSDEPSVDPELNDLLIELRALRGEYRTVTDKLSLLEKRLRLALKV